MTGAPLARRHTRPDTDRLRPATLGRRHRGPAVLLLAVAGLVPAPLASAQSAAAAVEGPGVIDSVTIYRGQALVSRVVDVPGPAGLREVVVTALPEDLIPASLYAESADGLEVRSVSYRERPLPEDARESVRKVEEQIRQVDDRLQANAARGAYLEWHQKYLDKLENYLAGTAQVENGRGVLNADTLVKMTEFIAAQRLKATDELQKLALDRRALGEQHDLLERERDNLTARTSRTAREAVVLVEQQKAGSRLRLNYLVGGATWSPSFNLRAPAPAKRGDAPTVAVEYQASIQQMSGEDWKNVAVTLSTATPALVATGPALSPMTIALSAPVQQEAAKQLAGRDVNYADNKKALMDRQRSAENSRNLGNFVQAQSMDSGGGGGGMGGGGGPGIGAPSQSGGNTFSGAALAQVSEEADKSLNRLANESQLLDLLTRENLERRGDVNRLKAASPSSEEGVSVTYALPARTSIPSRADQQLIQISSVEAPASFSKVATPVLTAYVYDEAVVTNDGSQVFLSGPAASYAGGEFVGRGLVPTVASGETFTAGFGIDSALRASRELVERTESIQGGNRVVEFTYRLVLENFGKDAAKVRLLDRVPTPKGRDIRFTLISTGREDQPLSTDPAYEQTQKKNGILRWDVTVPGGANGTKSWTLEYKFKLEYDKQMSISETAAK